MEMLLFLLGGAVLAGGAYATVVAVQRRRGAIFSAVLQGRHDVESVESDLVRLQDKLGAAHTEQRRESLSWDALEMYPDNSKEPSYTVYHVRLSLWDQRFPAYLDLRPSLFEKPDLRELLLPGELERMSYHLDDGDVWLQQQQLSQLLTLDPRAPGSTPELSLRCLRAIADVLVEVTPQLPDRLFDASVEGRQREQRLRALRTLCRHYPQAAQTEVRCGEAIKSAFDEERLLAAQWMGAKVLLQTLPSISPEKVPEPQWLQAMEQGSELMNSEQQHTLWLRALATARPQLVHGALDYYRQAGLSLALPAVSKLLQSSDDHDVIKAIVRALDALPAEQTEPLLIEALSSKQATGTAILELLINTLGRLGSVAAVPVLRSIQEDSSGEASLRESAELAVAQIQERVGGETRGGLAMVGLDQRGALSLEGSGAGAVALVEESEAE